MNVEYCGRTRACRAVCGRLTTDDLAEFVAARFRAGWRTLPVSSGEVRAWRRSGGSRS